MLPTKRLILLGGASLLIYLVITWLSRQFAYDIPQSDRPLLITLSLFAVAVAIYLFAIRDAIRPSNSQADSRSRWITIVGFALAFRAILLFSEPIQEVDIYRYLWDGLVSNQAISPFAYAPETILLCQDSDDLPSDLRQLVQLRDSSPGIQQTLARVHFAHLPTVYPPVSQIVFAAATRVTPLSASVTWRVRIMKGFILLFDVATICCIAGMLRLAKRNSGWIIAYAWCPLVLKEFANSGHLDAIAVFLSSLSIYCAAKAFFAAYANADEQTPLKPVQGSILPLSAAALLGLAVGAKLFPVALAPLLVITSLRKLGWLRTVMATAVFCLVTVICLMPIVGTKRQAQSPPNSQSVFAAEPTDRQAGFKTFLSEFMMNDLIFLTTIENLTPDSLRIEGQPRPWFLVTTADFRQQFVDFIADNSKLVPRQIPFVAARAATAGAFSLLAFLLAWQAASTTDLRRWLELVFLTMAWFWLLLPTLNPWYWIWALPWVGFCRNRAWLAMSGVLFCYYLRFHFQSLDPTQPILGTPYAATWFFDYVVVWFEYIPWFLCLMLYHRRGRIRS